jgi:homopolymeric O-antigen transport system permease protein
MSSVERETVIQPPRAFGHFSLAELWVYRGLIVSMMRKRISAEFERQHLAYLWVVARPLLMVVVFVLFRNLAEARPGVTVPYSAYLLSGLVLWFFFTEAVIDTATSLKQNAHMLHKVYFPRLIPPLAMILSHLIFLAIAFVPLMAFMIFLGTYPDWKIVLLPVIVLQLILLIFGLGAIFAALGLASSDWDKILTFALYLGLFVSPVIYSNAIIPPHLATYYALNPMVGTLEALRAALFADAPWPPFQWYYSIGASVVLAAIGFLSFQRAERSLVDRL